MSTFLRFLVLLCASTSLAWAENAPRHTYETVNVTNGIVAFIASESNTGIVSGNCIAVIGDDGVLVVDSTNFPSHARQIIADIKHMTDQPVREIAFQMGFTDQAVLRAYQETKFSNED